MNHKTSALENFLFRRGGKYIVIGISIAAVHTFYLMLFYMIGSLIMTIYNLISIAGYLLFSAEAYKGSNIKRLYIFSVIEIPLHSTLATVFLGWNYEFMLVTVASISIVYYFILFIDKFKYAVHIATIISVFYIIVYIGVSIHSSYVPPIISNIKNNAQHEIFYSYFNTLVSGICIVLFNFLFAVEYTYIKNRLLTENNKLDTYATYDPLTGLLNRRSTESHLQHLFDAHYHEEDSFSVIMCDIDKFKLVNDTYGHDAGDFVLKEVAWIIKDQIRENDAVGRWGGEEFLILVKGKKNNATTLAERIRSKVEQHTYTYKNLNLNVTITLGVSAYHSNSDFKSLIKSADMKLYRGKENGRNQVVS